MYKISLITGDGIGPELSESVKTILDTIHDKLNVKFNINNVIFYNAWINFKYDASFCS